MDFDEAMKGKADEAAAPATSDGAAPPSYDGAPTPGFAASAPPSYAATTDTGPARYTSVSASQACVYIVRSDGLIDRSDCNGDIFYRMEPTAPHKYIGVAAGISASYLTRSDGIVVRTKGSGRTYGVKSEVRPPPNVTYLAASAGPHDSFLVRSDGKIDRTKYNGAIDSEMAPEGWPAVTYTSASAGFDVTYLVRSDGAVDLVKRGAVTGSMVPAAGTKYISVGDQLTMAADENMQSQYASYIVRDDGAVIRVVNSKGDINRTYPPPAAGVTYIAASSGARASYLLRSDGKADRIKGWEGYIDQTVDGTARASKASDDTAKVFTYVAVSAGQSASYLLRSDGMLDRTKKSGKISEVMGPSQAVVSGCSLM